MRGRSTVTPSKQTTDPLLKGRASRFIPKSRESTPSKERVGWLFSSWKTIHVCREGSHVARRLNAPKKRKIAPNIEVAALR